MLIKLVPESHHPSVLFAITFTNAPFVYVPDKPHAFCIPEEGCSEKSVIMSAGWASQLNTLALDDLDLPTSLHVMDRSAGIPTLLQEVALDVSSKTVRCSFVDGSVEEWVWPFNPQTPVPANKRPVASTSTHGMQQYMDMLESIVNDVAQSAVEEERDRQKDLYSMQQQQQQQQQEYPGRTSSEISPPASPRFTVKTHQKRRSFFMNIVASIVNLTPSAVHLHPRPPLPLSPKRSTSPALIPLSHTPPPTPTCLKSPFPPLWSPPNSPIRQTLRSLDEPASAARTLRRHARSALVDAFRRFVLPEIIARASYGTYRNYHAINVGICGTDGSGKVGAGYYAWAIESMLRKASQRMDELANMATTTAVGTEKEKDRKIKSRIFPRFTVPRRKSVQASEPANQTQSVTHYRRSVEIRAEQERQDAEYFASTTQSIPPVHLFSDEEDSAEDGQTLFYQREGSDATLNGDDTDSDNTDTDGSSVHTPSSGHESLPLAASKPTRQSKLPLLVSTRHSRNVSRIVSPTSIQAKGTLVTEGPPPGSLPPTEMAEYKALSRLSGKLQHLLFAAQARASQAENEAKQRDATLEVRSRRRAWLNRALRSWTPGSSDKDKMSDHMGTYCYISTCTMSTPNSSSPLARWTWTSEDWEFFPDACVGEDNDIILQERTRFLAGDESEAVTFGHPLRRGRDLMSKGQAMLFPVVEEDEEEWCRDVDLHEDEETLIGVGFGDDDELRELESGLSRFNLDVDAGEIAWDARGEDAINSNSVGGTGIKVVIEPERPRVRVRTSSMYESPFGRPQFQQTIDLSIERRTSPESASPTRLSSTSLLCQPLTNNNASTSTDDTHNSTEPPLALMEKADKSPPMICASFAGEIRDSDEFTLSMDLPPPMKGRSHISTFGTVSTAQSLTIFAPTPQGGRQIQLSTVPDAR